MVLRGCNNKVKGICSIISAILMRFLTGNLLTFPNVISYYEVFADHKFSKNQLYFVAPAGIFTFNALTSVSGMFDDKYGTRVSNFIATVLLIAYQLLMYFFKVYPVLIISYILLGLAMSLTYFPSLRNCWHYFPERKGLISGILFSFSGLGPFIFTSLADGIVKTDDKEGKNEEQIVKSFKLYLLIVLICIIVLGISACVLCFPYEKVDEYIAGLKLLPDEDDEDQSPKDEKNNSDEAKNEEKEQLNEKQKKNQELKEALCSKDFALCLILSICTLIFGFLLTNTYRTFGEVSFIKGSGGESDEKNRKILKALSKVFTLLNTVSRIIWGPISDRVSFKILYPIVCIIQIICGATIYFSASNITAYFIIANLGVLSYAGHVTLFPSLINTKFGVEKSVFLLGICGIFNGIAALIGPILTIFALKEKKDYLIVYLVGAAPSIVSLFISIFIKIEVKPKEEPKNNITDDHYYDDVEESESEKEDKKGKELNIN